MDARRRYGSSFGLGGSSAPSPSVTHRSRLARFDVGPLAAVEAGHGRRSARCPPARSAPTSWPPPAAPGRSSVGVALIILVLRALIWAL